MFIKKILLISTFFYTSLCFAEDENFYTAFKSGASFGQNTGLVNYDNNIGEGGAATLENSDLSFYGIKYKKDSVTEKCIDEYIPLTTDLWGEGKLDPTEVHAFFKITTLPNGEYFITGSNKGSNNTNISDISNMSMFVANCIIKNK